MKQCVHTNELCVYMNHTVCTHIQNINCVHINKKSVYTNHTMCTHKSYNVYTHTRLATYYNLY